MLCCILLDATLARGECAQIKCMIVPIIMTGSLASFDWINSQSFRASENYLQQMELVQGERSLF